MLEQSAADSRQPWMTAFDPRETACFLDVDGTLLGFRNRPEEVVADAALIALLAQLRDAVDGALALVSGRKVSDLDRIVAPLSLPAAGLHGADLRFADQRRVLVGATLMDPIRGDVQAFVGARPGLMLEDKGATLAIHFRHAPDREREVIDYLAHLRHGHDMAVQEGKLVAELKPVGCNKGHAIREFMTTPPFAGRRPLFIGDDLTDEHGFEAVNALGGVAIKVGSPEAETLASRRLRDPDDVRAFLSGICQSDCAE